MLARLLKRIFSAQLEEASPAPSKMKEVLSVGYT
jgi:hypothetical protein